MQLEDNQQTTNYRASQSVGGAAEFQAVVSSLMGKNRTIMLAEVVSIEQGITDVSAVGFLSVRPMVFMIDGSNNNYERGVISKVPFFRLQCGSNAIVMNPQVGDIGLIACCDRDISMVKRTKKQAAPNSRRQFSINDALYIGGFLNGAPQQYIHFLNNGINIKTTGNVNINGLTIAPNGTLTLANGVIVDTHIHEQENDSNGDSEQPTGGPING